ncbi:tRNA dihydrouridine(16) synthase DusC, partial [Psychrobacter sp. 1U2]
IARVDSANSNNGWAEGSMTDSKALTWQALIPHQIKFLEGQAKNDIVLVGRYKQWLGMLTKGYSEAQILWESIKREKNKATIINALQVSAQS